MNSGWDKGQVFYNNTLQLKVENASNLENALESRCQAFLSHFRIDSQFIYRDQIRRNVSLQNYSVLIELPHLQAFDEHLATQMIKRPAEILPIFERVASRLAKEICLIAEESPGSNVASLRTPLSDMQVQLSSSTIPMAIRDLDAQHLGRLVRLPGIVVSASTVVARPTKLCVVCRGCRKELNLPVTNGFGVTTLPRVCPPSDDGIEVPRQRCPVDPFVLVAEKCHCVDQQTLKLQESPEMVPVGELPRQVLLTVDRNLVNKISPGTRLVVTGIYTIFQGGPSANKNFRAVAIRTPFIRVVGFQLDTEVEAGKGSSNSSRTRQVAFSEAEEREMLAFARQPELYERFSRSIAPSIFGNDDIKKAICCLLFGGSRKILPDRIKLRGDINVLLLGDPGVAKSQFLKFVEKVAPISVYTSGKGSSAAGLTASVVRDPSSGEFYLEGGAMVLADGGVVCIDEFDKMDNEDRVAIHEAMEQQTISIAKAGITTILNSRASVLAAANPVFGRYDELKTPGENIDFSTTILSRFDMIFVVKDEHNAQRDMTLARHVLSVHMNAHSVDQSAGEFDLTMMKKYITFCKAHCAPRLSAEAADKLSNHYVSIRSQVHQMEENSTERSSIPITIRQLEAIVRIAESLAKLSLSTIATEAHVDEALRLFRVSTMQAVISGHNLEGMARPDLIKEVDRVEKTIRQRLPIGSTVSYRNLVRELVDVQHYPEHAVVRAIDMLVQQEKLLFRSQRKLLIRQR